MAKQYVLRHKADSLYLTSQESKETDRHKYDAAIYGFTSNLDEALVMSNRQAKLVQQAARTLGKLEKLEVVTETKNKPTTNLPLALPELDNADADSIINCLQNLRGGVTSSQKLNLYRNELFNLLKTSIESLHNLFDLSKEEGLTLGQVDLILEQFDEMVDDANLLAYDQSKLIKDSLDELKDCFEHKRDLLLLTEEIEDNLLDLAEAHEEVVNSAEDLNSVEDLEQSPPINQDQKLEPHIDLDKQPDKVKDMVWQLASQFNLDIDLNITDKKDTDLLDALISDISDKLAPKIATLLVDTITQTYLQFIEDDTSAITIRQRKALKKALKLLGEPDSVAEPEALIEVDPDLVIAPPAILNDTLKLLGLDSDNTMPNTNNQHLVAILDAYHNGFVDSTDVLTNRCEVLGNALTDVENFITNEEQITDTAKFLELLKLLNLEHQKALTDLGKLKITTEALMSTNFSADKMLVDLEDLELENYKPKTDIYTLLQKM